MTQDNNSEDIFKSQFTHSSGENVTKPKRAKYQSSPGSSTDTEVIEASQECGIATVTQRKIFVEATPSTQKSKSSTSSSSSDIIQPSQSAVFQYKLPHTVEMSRIQSSQISKYHTYYPRPPFFVHGYNKSQMRVNIPKPIPEDSGQVFSSPDSDASTVTLSNSSSRSGTVDIISSTGSSKTSSVE